LCELAKMIFFSKLLIKHISKFSYYENEGGWEGGIDVYILVQP